MANTVGNLVIEMSANVARLQKDMAAARGHVATATKGMNSAIKTVKSSLIALGLGFGAVQVAGFTKGLITTQDELAKLSQRISVTVEDLAGMQYVAKLGNVQWEDMTKAIAMLAKNMQYAQLGMVTYQRYFTKLNVSYETANKQLRPVGDVLADIADRFSQMKDGAEKTALANLMLSESGNKLIPVLDQGSAAIREQIAEGRRLNPITAESAHQAEIFDNNMTLLAGTLKSGFIAAMNKVLPSIKDISDAMAQAAKDTGFWKAALVGLGGVLSHLFVPTQLQAANKEFSDLTAQMLKLEAERDRIKASEGKGFLEQFVAGSYGSVEGLNNQIDAIRNRLAALQKLRESLSRPAAPAAAKPAGGSTAPAAAATGPSFWTARDEEEYQMRVKAGKEAAAMQKHIEEIQQQRADEEYGMRVKAAEELKAYHQKLLEDTKKTTLQATEFWREAARNMQNAMSSFFFDIMQGNLNDLAGSFKRTVDQMVANMLAAKAATSLFGPDFADTGKLGGLIGSGLKWLKGSFATGTSYVPETGPYMLHQGEKVVPAAQNAAPGASVVVHQYFYGTQDRRSMSQAAADTGLVVQRALARNG